MSTGMSCKTCPSYISDDDQVRQRFGKMISAPMCGRYGHVLGRAGFDNSETTKFFAMNCDSYGQPMTSTPVTILPSVTTVDEQILIRGGTGKTVAACAGCENLIDATTVMTEFGWVLPICKAKGTLVFQPMAEAKGCPWASPGKATSSTVGVEIRRELRDGYFLPTEMAVKAAVSAGKTNVDPRTYPTDRDVSSEEDADGIRAWRRVDDPDGTGNFTYLPIFKSEKFTAFQRSLIPQAGDKEHIELYMDYAGLLYALAVDSFMLDETLALIGQPGNGKTEFFRWAAYLMQVPFRRFNLNEESDIEDLAGKWGFENGATIFHRGRIPDAYTETGVIVLDEYNTAPDAVCQFIRPMIDNSKQLVLDQAKGETCERDPYCFLGLTFNPSWDARNTGTKELAGADASRITPVHLDPPPPSIERHIIIERCKLDGYDIPAETLETIMAIALDIREFSDQGTFPGTWGIREQIKVARKTRWYGINTAYKRAALDLYEPETAALVIHAINSLLGIEDPESPDQVNTDNQPF